MKQRSIILIMAGLGLILSLTACVTAPAGPSSSAEAVASEVGPGSELALNSETATLTPVDQAADDKAGLPDTDGETDSLEAPFFSSQPHGKPASHDEFAVTFTPGPLQLNPLKSYRADEAQIFTALYEGLFSYHPLTMEPLPALAAEWELSADKLVWTFQLRDKARYWNGDPILADDFVQTWFWMIDPDNDTPYSSLFDLIAGVKDYRLGRNPDRSSVGIEALGPRSLRVSLASPAAFFPHALCHHSFVVVHPKMLKLADWNSQVPISNGPFYIIERDASQIVMAKNELYWDAKNVALKRLVLRFPTDGVEAAGLWDSGEVQWLAGEVNLTSLKDRSGIVVNALFATYYYFFHCAEAPWNDSRVRRALALILPWEEIRQDYHLPASTLIYPVPNYPKVTGIEQANLEEAWKLLSEAGFSKTRPLPELVIRITPSNDSAQIANLMKTAWEKELALEVKIDVVDYELYYDSLANSDYQIGAITWIGDFADPYTFLQMWTADSNLNDARYRDSDFEALIERSMTEEGEDRWRTLALAEEQLLSGAVVLPICYSPALNVIDTDEVKGWYPNPLDIHPFKYLFYSVFKALPGVAQVR